MTYVKADITPSQMPAASSALQAHGIWIAPQYAGTLSKADLARIDHAAQAAATAGVKTYIVVGDVSYGNADFPGGVETMLRDAHSRVGREGAYLAVSPGASDHGVVVVAYPDRLDASVSGLAAHRSAPPGTVPQLVATLNWLAKGGASDYLDAQQARDHPETASGAGAGSGSGSTGTSTGAEHRDGSDPALGIGATVVVVLAVIAAAVALTRRRRRSGAELSGRFQPGRKVLATVRAAEDRTWAERAQATTLALGEAIDETTMPAAPTAAWQAALDHYDMARRLVDAPGHRPADDIGALVLADRGLSALAAAAAGQEWSPTPTCYFNPLHGSSSGAARWQSIDVPACRQCARAIRAGREPDDVLDLVEHGTPRHYFNLDLGAWSRTGYGSLNTDLLGALLDDHR